MGLNRDDDGPDVNISLPESLEGEVDQDSLNEKINYYIPPVVKEESK